MRYKKVTIREERVLFDDHKWERSGSDFAVTSNCQYIAVYPNFSFDLSDERYERIYLYLNSGQEVKNLKHSNGGELGLFFWPDDSHLVAAGYNMTKMEMTIAEHSLRDGDVQYPFEGTVLDCATSFL